MHGKGGAFSLPRNANGIRRVAGEMRVAVAEPALKIPCLSHLEHNRLRQGGDIDLDGERDVVVVLSGRNVDPSQFTKWTADAGDTC